MHRVYVQSVTVAAGTSSGTPMSVAFPLERGTLDQISIRVPDGHAGLTGIRVKRQDVNIVPWTIGGWLISNDEIFPSPVDMYIEANDLTIQAYNTDIFDHTFYLRATMSDQEPQQSSVPTVTPADQSIEQVPLSTDPLSPDALLSQSDIAAILINSSSPDTVDLTAGV